MYHTRNKTERRAQKTSRVLYFVCELARCGEPDFISQLNTTPSSEGTVEEDDPARVLLFSTN